MEKDIKAKLIAFGWIATVVLLFLYSFTQIDLGLTLTRISWWQVIQKNFQAIGYFNRPLSTSLYLGILLLLFSFYLLILKAVKKGWFTPKKLWWLILVTAVILWFSYNAFSYDLFNYIFDAKIVAFYHQNPYGVKPLDFPDDPMTRFMHWTHRPSVYPPLWIGLSIVPFVLGLGKFTLQLLLFKAMMAGFYLGTIWLIWKISEVLTPKQKMFNVAFYAFSPLVLIESLVSGHNDGVMVFFALFAFYFLLKKKDFLSFLSWLFSIGIKYITVILLPVFALAFWQKIRVNPAPALWCGVKKIDYQKLTIMAILSMYLAIFAISYYLGLQPWYLLWVLPFVALKAKDQFFAWFTISFSLGCLLRYAPFLYYGHWNTPVPNMKLWLTALPVGLSFLVYFIKRWARKYSII